MNAADEPDRPALGGVVSTACGGLLRLEPTTPQSVFRGQRIYFCLSSCKESFDRNPRDSCLAGNPLLEEPS